MRYTGKSGLQFWATVYIGAALVIRAGARLNWSLLAHSTSRRGTINSIHARHRSAWFI